jgi:putative FmdB family regulatory protein
MPIYEYECSSCHFHFDRKQRFDEEPVAMCPKCRGKARRVIHSVPVIFKGSGFYITDNRKGVTEPVKGEGELPGEGRRKKK